MKYIRRAAFISTVIFILFNFANACEQKGEIDKTATFPLGSNQCHQFKLAPGNEFYQITAYQKGVDVELRLFRNDTEIKTADSENLNSGFEFLPFITDAEANYTLQVRWVDDLKSMIKNDGLYTLEIERCPLTDADESFVEQFDKAKSLYERATADRLKGNQAQAIAGYLSAIEIYRSLSSSKGIRYKMFLTNYYLGVAYNSSGKYAEAVLVLEKIRPIAGENQDKYLENLLLRELGIAYFKTGNYQKSDDALGGAVSGFEQSVAENIGEKQALAAAYVNQSETFLSLGRLDAAIATLEKVRANFKENATENILASLKLADVYIDFGSREKAVEIITTLTIKKEMSDYIKGVFNKISGKLFMKSDPAKALAFFNKAVQFLAADEDENTQLLLFTGNAHYYAADYKSARLYYEQAKAGFERQNNQGELAQVLNNLGVVYYHQKDYVAAVASCEAALNINTETQNDLNRARNLINLMYFYEAAANEASAIFYGKWAINTVQTIKFSQLQTLESEIQDNFRDSFTDAFRNLAELLIKAGRISEAEQVLRFIKVKEYQDYIRGEGKLNSIAYTKEEARILAEIKAGEKFAARKKTSESGFPKETSPTGKLIEALKKQNVKVEEILFVSTLVTEKNIYLIAHLDQKQQLYVQSVPRATVNKIVFEFREALLDPSKNPKIAGKKLFDILIKPLEAKMLSPRIRKIVWSLDGALRYVSIPALFDGRNYLVRRFANIQLTLASEEKILFPKSSELSAIGFASSRAFEDLPSLPAAKNELDCIFEDGKRLIINSTCKKGIIQGKKVVDEEFTRDALEDALRGYKLIHLTSHFVMQPGDSSNSYLLLGGGSDRKYTMQSFSKQQLNNTEILIMSACNTATFSSDGDEFESFATMAQKQGAKAVIGTLWPVADNSTASFMTEFYRLFEVEKLDKAEAIRVAQINVAKNKIYAHPFYWSPFVLFGNWS
jgi:CHAT domain-containing protein